ncbi:single-stranded DNA-binding protein [Streptomyces sp. NPDC090106]|uniref:single-stranded DNA-binding protein n=1 Tax=Streptomyces sp. NPDC090106 TaxID=3365946 RepID=UPI0038230ED5
MSDTIICVVGNVATQPVYQDMANGHGPSARFRLAVTRRYLNRERNEWVDGHTSFFTVWANRQLATNAAASLSVGDPVVVQGRLRVRSDTREGQNRTSVDIDASTIGHDLARGVSTFRRGRRPDGAADQGPGTGAVARGPEPEWETPAADRPEQAEPEREREREPVAVT